MEKEYKKNLEDEIDWKIIDQLHAATISFSNSSLELKKLFFVLIGISVPSLIKLAGDKVDLSLFVSVYILTITFWLLDSYTYYYQEKLRQRMNSHFSDIRKRNIQAVLDPEGDTIELYRNSKGRLVRSLFNFSLILYLFIFSINTLGVVLYLTDVVK